MMVKDLNICVEKRSDEQIFSETAIEPAEPKHVFFQWLLTFFHHSFKIIYISVTESDQGVLLLVKLSQINTR